LLGDDLDREPVLARLAEPGPEDHVRRVARRERPDRPRSPRRGVAVSVVPSVTVPTACVEEADARHVGRRGASAGVRDGHVQGRPLADGGIARTHVDPVDRDPGVGHRRDRAGPQ